MSFTYDKMLVSLLKIPCDFVSGMSQNIIIVIAQFLYLLGKIIHYFSKFRMFFIALLIPWIYHFSSYALSLSSMRLLSLFEEIKFNFLIILPLNINFLITFYNY